MLIKNVFINTVMNSMPKLQQTKDRYFITMPVDMVNKKGWTKGVKLLFTWNERGNIEIHD